MSKPIKIVVIDDSPDDRMLYRRSLQGVSDAGCVIHEAEDGEAGLKAIDEHEPECVLLDYSLPGRDGIEILKAIRRHYPFMPVVMLTGQGNEMVAVTAMKEGAQNYISKYFITTTTLEHVIRMAIEWCSLQRRLHEQRISLEVFTRALAHDLKEPVRTIRSFVELIGQYEKFEGKTANCFQHIQNAAERMAMLIDTVFFYTRLDAPDQAACEICDASEIVKETKENLAQLIRERQATIECENLPRIYVNRTQMMQVLQNLIGNAIHHSEKPVTILISADEHPDHWLFLVADNGPGIETEYLNRIFEPFKRLTHKEIQGAGLGLSICQRIIEAHGGKIWCESQPRRGATFLFTLPKALPDQEAKTEIAKTIKAEKLHSGNGADKHEGEILANVLLVDDSRADVEIAKFRLVDQAGLQCNLFVARGGEEALDFLHQQQPQPPIDLMLLDINMPEMDGFELLERIRKDKVLKDVAVVMCTGSIYDKDIARAQALGACGYLTKPIEFSKLKSLIDTTPNFQLRQENDKYLLLRAA